MFPGFDFAQPCADCPDGGDLEELPGDCYDDSLLTSGHLLSEYAWYKASSLGGPHATRSEGLLPNDLGIYDVHGNVAEWCHDGYGSLSADPAEDPTGSASSSVKVVRGGAFDSCADDVRLANRDWASPDSMSATVGFRLVRRAE